MVKTWWKHGENRKRLKRWDRKHQMNPNDDWWLRPSVILFWHKNSSGVSQIGDAMFHIDVSKHQAYSADFFLCFHVWSMMWMSTFAYVYSGWNEHIVSFCHWSLSLVIVHSEDFWVLDWFFNLLHFQIQHIQISQKGVEFSSVKSVPVESHQSHFWGFSCG